jgi:hypothetical protein
MNISESERRKSAWRTGGEIMAASIASMGVVWQWQSGGISNNGEENNGENGESQAHQQYRKINIEGGGNI